MQNADIDKLKFECDIYKKNLQSLEINHRLLQEKHQHLLLNKEVQKQVYQKELQNEQKRLKF